MLRGEDLHIVNDVPFISKLFMRGQHTVCVTAQVTDGVQLRCLTARLQHALQTRLGSNETVAMDNGSARNGDGADGGSITVQPVPYLHLDAAGPVQDAQRHIAGEVEALRKLAANSESIGFTNSQIIQLLQQQRDADEALGLVAELQLDF